MKTKMLAIMAVAAFAFLTLAITVPMAGDSDATDVYPTAYGQNSGLKVIAYSDETLLIDTNTMTNLAEYREFTIEVNVGTASGTYTTATNTIGPISLQNGRIYISAPALDATSAKFTQVKLYGYGNASALATVTFTYVSTGATFDIHTTHDATWTTVNLNTTTSEESWTDSEATAKRTITHKMDTSMDDEFSECTDYGYRLVGFTTTVGDKSTLVIEPTATMKCEDIILAAGAITYDGETDPATNKISLYAYWEVASYNIYVYDDSTEKYITTNSLVSATITATVDASTVTVAKANATSLIGGQAYGLLRIVQDTNLGQYTYAVTLYKDDSSTAVADDGSEGSYTYLNNGTYRINVTSNDLYINIVATDVSANLIPTSYSMDIDFIKNTGTSGAAPGRVNLSLDLYDYTPTLDGTVGEETAEDTSVESIRLDGTYYVTSADGNTRIYGSLKYLADASQTYTLKGDNGAPVTGLLVEADRMAYLGYVTADDTPMTSYRSYDLELNLGAGYSIYAAQGVLSGINGDAAAAEVTTPWALVSA